MLIIPHCKLGDSIRHCKHGDSIKSQSILLDCGRYKDSLFHNLNQGEKNTCSLFLTANLETEFILEIV
jgi:hypothetical protein